MINKLPLIMFFTLFFMATATSSEAALYTDDTCTTTPGHFETEFSVDYYKDIEDEYDPETEEYTKIIFKMTELSIYTSYGLTANWDVGVTCPYQFLNDSNNGEVNGFSDIFLESKYRFWNESKFLPSFALYFDLKTDSANDEKFLGTGKKDYTLNSILTKNIGNNAFDLNLGYIFVGDQADDIFFYSFDFSRDLTDKIGICSELYGETNFKGDFDENIFCLALSLIYQINKIISFESGIGIGISKASPDYQFSNSLTLSF